MTKKEEPIYMWMASIPLFMGCFEICKSQIVNWLNKTKKIKFFKADLHFQFTEGDLYG